MPTRKTTTDGAAGPWGEGQWQVRGGECRGALVLERLLAASTLAIDGLRLERQAHGALVQ